MINQTSQNDSIKKKKDKNIKRILILLFGKIS